MINANDPINSIPDLNEHPSSWYGLTKREYFAAMAMQGLAAVNDKGIFDSIELSVEFGAKLSVKMADALINALNESKC